MKLKKRREKFSQAMARREVDVGKEEEEREASKVMKGWEKSLRKFGRTSEGAKCESNAEAVGVGGV